MSVKCAYCFYCNFSYSFSFISNCRDTILDTQGGDMTLREIAEVLIWFPPMINIFAISCQVGLSARLRSVQGVSTYMLVLRFIAASSQVLYLNFLNMAFGYRVMIMPQWFLLCVMLYQQIRFAETRRSAQLVVISSVSIFVTWIIAIMVGFSYPDLIGHAGGWLMVMLGTITQLPQIFRNWRRKSVKGYSKKYVIFSVSAYAFDLTLAAIIGVPIQTYITYGRAISYRMIELLQFSWYDKKSKV